jgi:hypothetical protein
MEKRLLAVLGAVAVAVVAVGFSAAATMTRGESSPRAKKTQTANPEKKSIARSSQRTASDPAVTSRPGGQSAKEVESYWTKERMEDAQPMGKTRQGGTPSSSPAPSGTTLPGSAPTQTPAPQKSRTAKSQAAGDGVVASHPAVTPAPGYWTGEAMDGAQPMEKTRPGGSGSQGSPGSGGLTAPGSPPS